MNSQHHINDAGGRASSTKSSCITNFVVRKYVEADSEEGDLKWQIVAAEDTMADASAQLTM